MNIARTRHMDSQETNRYEGDVQHGDMFCTGTICEVSPKPNKGDENRLVANREASPATEAVPNYGRRLINNVQYSKASQAIDQASGAG